MGILNNKDILITGVLTDSSLAFHIAKVAQEQGARIYLTGFGRGLSITKRVAKKLGDPPVYELDATDEQTAANLSSTLQKEVGKLDGVIHAIAYAPPECLAAPMLETPWQSVSKAIEVSAFSLKTLTKYFLPLLEKGKNPSVIALDFDATKAWPAYNWMGVAKAALESLNRYLARELGPKKIRFNLIASGPVKTVAAKSIPGFELFEDQWATRAPLGWNPQDATPVANVAACVLSDFFEMVTGQIIYVDGGFSSQGA